MQTELDSTPVVVSYRKFVAGKRGDVIDEKMESEDVMSNLIKMSFGFGKGQFTGQEVLSRVSALMDINV